jgi:hypothetical protein
MNVTWKDDEVARARRRQLQQEADAVRLTNQLSQTRRRPPAVLGWLAALLLRLGGWMVATGCRLQSRTSDALVQHPLIARLELSDSRSGPVTVTRGC